MGADQGYWRTVDDAGRSSPRAGLLLGNPEFLAFFCIVALIGGLRITALAANNTDLYMDEAQYWAWSQDLALGYFSKPPLIAWIIGGATAICGDAEACVRLPSVVLHGITALLVYGIAARLYPETVAFWAGLGYALLPAVSLSSGIISTDVPLLAAWALAVFAFVGLLATPTWHGAALLALALGLGLNAKYAMAYFILCAGVYFVVAPRHRLRLAQPHLWLALAGGLALVAPNIAWNVTNGFVTFAHTADNAQWRGVPFHPNKAAEFVLSQFGVFGPILFGVLLVIAWRAMRRPLEVVPADKLLLSFALPILLLVTMQALVSRAHPNWAAPAYVAAVVLVTAVMLRDRAFGWMRASLVLHVLVAVGLAFATWQAGRVSLPGVGNPFARSLGNHALGQAVGDEVELAARKGTPVAAILTDDRELAAALAYYGRDLDVPVLSWRSGPARSYFEMIHPFSESSPTPVLLVSLRAMSPAMGAFGSAGPSVAREIAAGQHASRTVYFSTLSRFRGG